MNFDELLSQADLVETTSEASGYPSNLSMAFTCATMSALRELRAAAIEDVHNVTEVLLHRQDGWALWHRKARGWIIDNTNWQSSKESDTVLRVDNKTNIGQDVFDLIVGDASRIRTMDELRMYARACEDLLNELADPDDMEDGESIVYFLDPDQLYSVRYEVHSDQNGYSYDTHQYCIGLLIKQNEAGYWDGDESLKR